MKFYDPANWFWLVGAGDDVRIYDSSSNVYVEDEDAAFVAFQEAGGVASRVSSEADLWGIIHVALPTKFPTWLFNGETFVQDIAGKFNKSQLAAYAANKRFEAETAGIVVNGVQVATDRESQALINGAYNFAQLNPGVIFKFKSRSGFTSLDKAAIEGVAVAVAEHIQSCFAAESLVVEQIEAGTATIPDIDEAFAALG